ncbi:MAG: hypothetical protein ACI3XR_08490 [Eubacteriales bacterium]
MTKSEFRKAMCRGLGRCIMELQNPENREKFRECVLWGCLHNLSFDTQCEGTRSTYLYDMVKEYDDPSAFALPIIEKFDKMSIHRYGWIVQHFTELLSFFAGDGDENAKAVLRKKYDALYHSLRNRRYLRQHDSERDNMQFVAFALMASE